MRRSTRFVSDSLQFTGTDLGDRNSGTRLRRKYGESEDSSGVSSSNDSDSEEEEDDDSDASEYVELSRLSVEEREDYLVESAMRRISQAQAMGETDVSLRKEEIAALEQRRKRIEEEEERERRKRKEEKKKKKKRQSGSGSDRKKLREQRIAVPLTQLEPISRKKVSSKSTPSSSTEFPPRQDSLSREVSGSNDLPPHGRDRQGYPPVGYFPPPSSSRSRLSAGPTFTPRPSSRAHDEYEHSSRASSANRPPSSRDSPRETVSTISARSQFDPFRYQTAGPRAPYPTGTGAPSRRHKSGPPETTYGQRQGVVSPAAARSYQGSRRNSYGEYTSEDESSRTSEESTSDDHGNGAQIREPVGKTRGRRDNATIIVEESPERPAQTKSRKKKSSSPVKRKPLGGKKKKK